MQDILAEAMRVGLPNASALFAATEDEAAADQNGIPSKADRGRAEGGVLESIRRALGNRSVGLLSQFDILVLSSGPPANAAVSRIVYSWVCLYAHCFDLGGGARDEGTVGTAQRARGAGERGGFVCLSSLGHVYSWLVRSVLRIARAHCQHEQVKSGDIPGYVLRLWSLSRRVSPFPPLLLFPRPPSSTLSARASLPCSVRNQLSVFPTHLVPPALQRQKPF